MSVQQIIDEIKQKHWKELDAEDFAFMKAREDYLTETEKAIYIEGQNPVEVMAEAGEALTANERIINENRPLQEHEMRIRASRNAALAMELAATVPLEGKARTDAQKQADKERETKFASLEEQVKVNEKVAADAEKERQRTLAEEEKRREKAQPVVIVGREV